MAGFPAVEARVSSGCKLLWWLERCCLLRLTGNMRGTTAEAVAGTTAVVKDDTTIPQVVCRPGGTLVEHP
jgi:hypothetical protein